MVEILSGVHEGVTLGTPIAMLVRNQDNRGGDYEEMRTKYRPSHADYTYQAKYGIRAWQGGGRASARETVGRVAAGAVAQKVLASRRAALEIVAWVQRVQDIEARSTPTTVTPRGRRGQHRALPRPGGGGPDDRAHRRRSQGGRLARRRGRGVARGVPAGLGEPVFDKLEADLAKAMMSLPAAKGFEIGSGFAGTRLTGSGAQRSVLRRRKAASAPAPIAPAASRAGSSNGEAIVLRVAFKPTATILQRAGDRRRRRATTRRSRPRGRHDPCVLPRAVPIVEAMIALVLADHALRQRGQCG